VVVVALVAAGIPIGLTVHKHREERAQRLAAEAFTRAWKVGDLGGISYANAPGKTVGAAVQKITRGLTSAATDSPAEVTLGAITSVAGAKNTVSAALQVTWKLAGGRTWHYPTTLTLTKKNGTWLPQYQPSLIHPQLKTGSVLKAVTQQAQRGEIIGANNDVLVAERPVVTIGLVRSRTTDVAGSADQVASITGVDGAALAKRVNAAGNDVFVQAITLREAAYQNVRSQLQAVPGTVFQSHTLSLGPSPDFARALLGTVGTATAEVVKASEGRLKAGDTAGLSGLEATYDARLAGTSGLKVQIVPAAGTAGTSSGSSSTATQTLLSDPPVAGKSVRITLDRKIQLAAQAALAKAKHPAALVAIRVGTGEVLAVGNGPAGADGYNRAFLGRYPPGSTFKVVTGLSLLGAGITPQTTVNCPKTINVGGRTFKNSEAEKLGSVAFHLDFANSCNTAFISTYQKISVAELAKTAKTLGYGQPNQLGVPAFTGQVPSSGDAVAHAASMIGQGTVLTSPVTVAGASAAVAAGRWSPPRLVVSGNTSSGTPAGSIALSTKSVASLRTLMRDVVTEGTAKILLTTPGGPVSGKTGTAEFGNANPPHTHAWFTGFQGDVAFAVVVEDGGFGAKAAAPIVKDFLTRLAAQ